MEEQGASDPGGGEALNPGRGGGDAVSEIWVLERRYRRLVGFDRWLWGLYALTAAIPAYVLCTRASLRGFHAVGVVLILVVAHLGWRANTRLLKGELRSEALPYFVTVALVVSRAGLAAWGVALMWDGMADQIAAKFGGEATRFSWADAWRAMGVFLRAPFIHALFAAGCYRIFYHISVHFLLKIQRVKAREGGL